MKALSGAPAVSRFGSPKLPVSGQLELVLPNFRYFASREPVSNRRRLDPANAGDFGLGPKVFKKVIRCHEPIISQPLQNIQDISNAQRDKFEGMDSWHNRFDFALDFSSGGGSAAKGSPYPVG